MNYQTQEWKQKRIDRRLARKVQPQPFCDYYMQRIQEAPWCAGILGGCCLMILLIVGIGGCAQKAWADDIPEATAVACILGEARGEGYASLLAHSEALRNRGTTQGVYGCKVVLSSAEAEYTRSMGVLESARRAWKQSKSTYTVKGAQYWGSTLCDKAWITKMRKDGFIQTAQVKNTIFFRKAKKL